MKRLLFIVLAMIATITSFAQQKDVAMFSFSVDAQDLSSKEVTEAYAEAIKSDMTTFLGIPVDGTASSMKQKLIAKGFKQDSNMLSGQFNGQDVYLSIVANKGKPQIRNL